MKKVSARATFSGKAEKLFGTRDAARETAKKIIDSQRSGKTGAFTVAGFSLRTERTMEKLK